LGVDGLFEQDTSIELDVGRQVVDLVIHVELPVVERELTQVVWSLWVERVESLNDLFIFLLSGQLLLINAAHIGLVHNEIIFILDVVRDLLLDDLVLLSLFLQSKSIRSIMKSTYTFLGCWSS
jgi:hypothetical protein